MQGQLNEIDVRSILQLLELGQRTGELLVEAYANPSPSIDPVLNLPLARYRSSRQPAGRSWLVFFTHGQISYAANADGTISRLRDYLYRYKLDPVLDSLEFPAIASINAPEYGYLWAVLEKRLLTPDQGRSIMQSMIQETLFDLLSLHQGAFIVELGSPLSPQLTTFEIGPLVARVAKQVQEWKQFHAHIQSPDQCPVITDPQQLREILSEATFNLLGRWVDGKTSIRQIARYLNREILTVAKALYPYVQQGALQLVDGPINQLGTRALDLVSASNGKVPHIVCIEDGATVRKAVEQILKRSGYEATAIADPLDAFSLVFQVNPDLILCDIAMPKLDGYELCAMLRQSTAFRQIPIIMLTGKDGFIDRVRAKMSGATDYLTKPFGASELLMLIEKYVGPGKGSIKAVEQPRKEI